MSATRTPQSCIHFGPPRFPLVRRPRHRRCGVCRALSRDSRRRRIPGEAKDLPPHHPAKAKRVIHICLCGGYSQLDTFDYKPELAKRHGQPLGGDEKPDVFFGQVGLLRKNDFEFQQRGQSGLWISDLFPHLAEQADELTVIRSMFAESSSHTPATMHENSRLSAERVSHARLVAVVRPGQRDRRAARVRRPARRPRHAGRRHEQLDRTAFCRPSTRE